MDATTSSSERSWPAFSRTPLPPIGVQKAAANHLRAWRYATRRVTISAAPSAWSVEVSIMKDLPVPVLLGRDWRVLTACSVPPHSLSALLGGAEDVCRRGVPKKRPTRDGESPSQNSNLYYDVFQQLMGRGTFTKDPHEDGRLKHCWSQVRVFEGKVQPAPHPAPHFMVQNGLLYCVTQRRGEEKHFS